MPWEHHISAGEKGQCQCCKLMKKGNFTQRKCPGCSFASPLCHTADHAALDQSFFVEVRALWFDKQQQKSSSTSSGLSQATSLAGSSQALSLQPTPSSARSSQPTSSQPMSSSTGSSQPTPLSAGSSQATSSAGSLQAMWSWAGSL